MYDTLLLNMALVTTLLLLAMAIEPRFAVRVRLAVLRSMLVVIRLPWCLPARQVNSRKLVEAEKLLNQGNFDESLKICNETIANSDYQGELLLQVIAFAFRTISGQKLVIPPGRRVTAAAHLVRARAYINLKQIDKAKEDLNCCIERSQDQPGLLGEAYVLYAAAESLATNYKDVIKYCDMGLKHKPKSPQLYSLRGHAHFTEQKLDEALADYNKAIELDPKGPTVFSSRAVIYQMQGKLDQALADCDRVVAATPKDALPYFLKSEILFKLKRYDEAIESLDKAIEINPKLNGAFTTRAALHAHKGEWQACIDDCTTALSYTPDSGIAYNNRAWALAHLGQFEQALPDAEEAVRLRPDRKTVFGTRAAVFIGLERFAEALADLNIAIGDDQSEGENYFNRGLAYEQLGQSESAKQDFAKAEELGFKKPEKIQSEQESQSPTSSPSQV